jgi:hypothetical protein
VNIKYKPDVPKFDSFKIFKTGVKPIEEITSFRKVAPILDKINETITFLGIQKYISSIISPIILLSSLKTKSLLSFRRQVHHTAESNS